MDKAYQDYLDSEDRIMIIGDKKYHKIFGKEHVVLHGQVKFKMIAISHDLFDHGWSEYLCDERGNTFRISRPSHYRFVRICPEWYNHLALVEVYGINPEDIGEYVMAMKDD